MDKVDSQWKITEKPNHCDNCKSFTVKVAHHFDKFVKLDDDVLPYRMDKFKLYQVDGHYVLASCGGTKIKDLENDDESKICSRLVGTNEAIPKMETLIEGVCIGIVDSDIEYLFDRDLKQLTIGSIGDNYWGGECKEYKRYITLLIENSEKLKSFKVTEVGFDDWIDLKINSKVFYQSPYQLPPNCELGTSFIEYPNMEIKKEINEGLNQLEMSVVVTGGGEGWFKVQLD